MKTIEGSVVGVSGSVVQVLFPKDKPTVKNLLVTKEKPKVVMEVYASKDEDTFYCLSLSRTDTLIRGTKVEDTGSQIQFPVGDAMLGRVVDIFGNPTDDKGKLGEVKERVPIHSLLPVEFNYQVEKVLFKTGIKAVDVFAPMLKGGKMGLLGGAGVGKTMLLTEILYNVVGTSKNTVSVFAGIGERSREGLELYESLKESNVLKNASMVFGSMGDNPAIRFTTGASATTLAEYFRDKTDKDVLFFADNIYRFAQAGNELSVLTGTLPSEDGYQATLEREMAILHERLISGPKGAITSIEAIYVPADDLLDHGVQVVLPYLDSVLVLSRDMYQQGILPAIDILASSSNYLSPDIVGQFHYQTVLEAKSIIKKAEDLQRIVSLVGESELSAEDSMIYKRAKKIRNYMTQYFSVATSQKGVKGVYVEVEEAVKDLNDIVAGKWDHSKEEDFLFIGTTKDIKSQD